MYGRSYRPYGRRFPNTAGGGFQAGGYRSRFTRYGARGSMFYGYA